MDSKAYELVAQGMRYWFAILIVYITIKIAGAVRRSFSIEKKIKKRAQGGYAVGMLEVIDGGKNKSLEGITFPLMQENLIGSSSKCEVRLKEKSVESVQAVIYLNQREKTIYLSDYGTRSGVGLNGYNVKEDVPLMDGDEIQLSNVLVRMHIKVAYARTTNNRYNNNGAPIGDDGLDMPLKNRDRNLINKRRYDDVDDDFEYNNNPQSMSVDLHNNYDFDIKDDEEYFDEYDPK